jgi:hypothetical protein
MENTHKKILLSGTAPLNDDWSFVSTSSDFVINPSDDNEVSHACFIISESRQGTTNILESFKKIRQTTSSKNRKLY